jgi:hypothetical protein
MKKRLNIDQVQSELRGGSAFFPGYKGVGDTPDPAPEESKPATPTDDTMIPRHHDTMVSRNHDTMIPKDEDTVIEVVRKAVKQIGKEAATYRFTLDEKKHLTDIKYTYKQQGIITSENEVTRIAINYFIEDYQNNGEASLLAKILKRLNS